MMPPLFFCPFEEDADDDEVAALEWPQSREVLASLSFSWIVVTVSTDKCEYFPASLYHRAKQHHMRGL
jgi:hypothetical protein